MAKSNAKKNTDLSTSQRRAGEDLGRLLQKIDKWIKEHSDQKDHDTLEEFNAAIKTMSHALIETRKYMTSVGKDDEKYEKAKTELSKLWHKASIDIRPYDQQLANYCLVKSHGWMDNKLWNHPNYRDLPIKLDQMIVHLTRLTKTPPKSMSEQKQTEKKRVYIFGIVFIIVILILAIFYPEPTRFQYIVFKIVLALAAAGIASQIPGFLSVNVANYIKATGAIAVFVIVFFYSPADLAVKKPNIEAIHMTFLDNANFETVMRQLEVTQNCIITYNNCDSSLRKTLLEIRDKQVDGNDTKGFIESLRAYIRDNSKIKYSVQKIKNANRYEITCN